MLCLQVNNREFLYQLNICNLFMKVSVTVIQCIITESYRMNSNCNTLPYRVANDPVSKEWKIIIVSSRSQMKTRSRLLSGLLGEGLFWRRPRPLLDREATSLPPLPSRVRRPLPLPPGPAVSVFTGDTGPFSDSWNPLGLSVGTKEANSHERHEQNYHTATLS